MFGADSSFTEHHRLLTDSEPRPLSLTIKLQADKLRTLNSELRNSRGT